MDGWMDVGMGGWMDGWMDRWMNGWIDRWIDRSRDALYVAWAVTELTDKSVLLWAVANALLTRNDIYGWMDGWMDG